MYDVWHIQAEVVKKPEYFSNLYLVVVRDQQQTRWPSNSQTGYLNDHVKQRPPKYLQWTLHK